MTGLLDPIVKSIDACTALVPRLSLVKIGGGRQGDMAPKVEVSPRIGVRESLHLPP